MGEIAVCEKTVKTATLPYRQLQTNCKSRVFHVKRTAFGLSMLLQQAYLVGQNQVFKVGNFLAVPRALVGILQQ